MTHSSTPARQRALALLRELRPFLGTLVVVPAIAVLFGSHWSWERSLTPSRVWKIAPDAGLSDRTREVRLHFFEDGSDPGRGVELGDGSSLLVELPWGVRRFEIVLQVDPNDFYLVHGGPDLDALQPLWKVRRERSESVLTTLRSPSVEVVTPIRYVWIEGLRGSGARAVAGLRLDLEPVAVPHLVLVPLLWGAWLLLVGARRRWTRWPDRALDAWRRADAWVAALLIGAVVLRTPDVLVYAFLVVLVIWALVKLLTLWLTRSPGSLVATAVVVGLLAWVVPGLLRAAITSRLAELHDLTVDHRPRPGGEINEDRIRFAGTAADLAEEDFVVLFLGDSFTFGETLEYEDAYPYAFEGIVSGFECDAPVRAVSAGWVSSSPLLALRLLREIGPRYRPDLVIYSLDMTDFHDDLLYEQRLREGGDLEIDAGEALVQVLVRTVPGLSAQLPRLEALRGAFRSPGEATTGEDAPPLPEDRFFVTSRPLESTRPDIERGVIANLAALEEHARDALGAPMALAVYPRAYQYSLREAPHSWEAHRYQALGPWVREPFRYFEESGDRLPYPVLSALEAFEESPEFPLFQEDDPHWNEAGAKLMAGTVARWAAESGLIPCRAPSP